MRDENVFANFGKGVKGATLINNDRPYLTHRNVFGEPPSPLPLITFSNVTK